MAGIAFDGVCLSRAVCFFIACVFIFCVDTNAQSDWNDAFLLILMRMVSEKT